MKHFFYIAIILYLGIFCGLSSCKKVKEQPLAKAFGKSLFYEEVQAKMRPNQNPADSLLELKKLVNEWALEQMKIHAAQKAYTLPSEVIENKVENYRNDLLVYYFEDQKIQEELDTLVTLSEMRTFYEKNKTNFLLGKDIVRLIFVKIKNNQKALEALRPLIKKPKTDDRVKLMELSLKHAVNSYLEDQVWLNFEDILKEIPLKVLHTQNFLQNNNYLEIEEGDYIYLVNIMGYQVKNSLSEFDIEKENIKKVILQNRKMDYIKQLNNELIKEAELNNDWESFVK